MTLAQHSRPPWLTLARLGGRIMAPAARPLLRLDSLRLIEAAQRQCGCAAFGEPRLFEPLHRLLTSLEQESRLNVLGLMAARVTVLRLLTNRLRLTRDRLRNPEIAAQPIAAPLFITGPPRSGTTFLHGLLAQDPSHRVFSTWEAMYPSPPPEPANQPTDRRIRRVAHELDWLDRLAPEFRRIHPVGARLPEECIMLMSHSFLSREFSSMFFVPGYDAWLAQQDLRPAYLVHRQLLQHLQAHFPPRRWLLKAPTHLWSLPELFETYPDAQVIVTHRDPLEVVASLASLHYALRKLFSDQVDPTAVGPEIAGALAEEVRRGLQARASGTIPADRLHDVRFGDLSADPIATVRSIYAAFGMTLTQDAETAMRRYAAERPRGKDGRHDYALAEYGLCAGREQERFGPYCESFGLGPCPAQRGRCA
jgi:Sulfotransferase family